MASDAILLAQSNLDADSVAPARRPFRRCYCYWARDQRPQKNSHINLEELRLSPWLVTRDFTSKFHQKGSMLQPFLPGPCVRFEAQKEHHLPGTWCIPLGCTPGVSTSDNTFGNQEVHLCANAVAALLILWVLSPTSVRSQNRQKFTNQLTGWLLKYH